MAQQDLAKQIKLAFADVREGSYAKANKLPAFGEKFFPLLEPYLNDESIRVKNDVVRIVLEIRGEKTLAFISQAINNSEPKFRISTANFFYLYYLSALKYGENGIYSKYRDFLPEKIAAYPQIGKSLQNDAAIGNVSVQSIFLLAIFPSQETEAVLKKLTLTPNYPDKENIMLASKIALARLGDTAAIDELTEIIEKGDVPTLKFLLLNLTEIDSIKVISALTKTLDNKTYIVKGNKNGIIHERTKRGVWIDYPVSHRICDLAVNSFVEKYYLKVDFHLHNGMYTEPQIFQVKTKLKAAKVSNE